MRWFKKDPDAKMHLQPSQKSNLGSAGWFVWGKSVTLLQRCQHVPQGKEWWSCMSCRDVSAGPP